MQAAIVTHKGGENNMFNQDYIKLFKNLLICCDGHGKERVRNNYMNTGGYASYVVAEFMAIYLEPDNILSGFDQAHKYLLHKMAKLLKNKNFKVKTKENELSYYRKNKWKQVAGGTTATIIIYHPEKSSITVSNVGDCFAILYNTTKNTFQILTEDHTPFSYSDYLSLKDRFDFCYGARIKGRINFSNHLYDQNGIENSPPEHCRYKSVRNEPYVLVTPKNKSFGLNMTRSIGDYALSNIGISHTPSINEYVVKPEEILLVASDGFMDNYTFKQLMNIITTISNKTPQEIINYLLADALKKQKKRYGNNGDNLSIGIMKFL